MLNTTTRPELAELDVLTTEIIELHNAPETVNFYLSDYPLVWDALIEGVAPDDEAELAAQANACADALRAHFA